MREYVLVPGHDPTRADRLARNLATQGIEVRARRGAASSVGSRSIPAGAYLVSNAQPAGRLMRNLLDLKTEQSADFIARQEERRQRRQPDQIYDITAWSLPLVYDVEVVTSAAAITAREHAGAGVVHGGSAGAPGGRRQGRLPRALGSAAAALTAAAARQGLRVESVGGAFTLGGRRYPIGTALVRTAGNPADLHGAHDRAGHGARRRGRAHRLGLRRGRAPRSAATTTASSRRRGCCWRGTLPTSSLSAGWTRYVLERRFGQAVTTVRTASLGRADFADYDVLVLPSGNYAGQIGDAVLNRLKDWLRPAARW